MINFLTQATKSYREEQTITVSPIAAKVIGQPVFSATATASSGLPVVLSAGTPTITVATDGKITLVKAGKANLKANQQGNSDFNPAPEVETIFCINPLKPSITHIINGAGVMTLTSSNTGGNQWYKDGTAVAGAVDNSLEVTTAGNYTVKTTVEECASELSNPFPVVVTGDVDGKLSSISLYPNPAEDRLYILLPGSNSKKVTLLQADGRVAEEHHTSASSLEVDVRSYAAGLYLVRVTDESGNHPTLKFIKK